MNWSGILGLCLLVLSVVFLVAGVHSNCPIIVPSNSTLSAGSVCVAGDNTMTLIWALNGLFSLMVGGSLVMRPD